VTNNFSRSDLETIFGILQNESNEISKEDIDSFLQEAENVVSNHDQSLNKELMQRSVTNFETSSVISMRDTSVSSLTTDFETPSYENDERFMLEMINQMIHKIDELRSFKLTQECYALITILFKLSTELMGGVWTF
jgi:hypothetical protein